MKNTVIIILAIIALANPAFSQSDEQFKATSGVTTEVGFTPFASEGPVIYLNNLNVRWFFKPEYALRLGLTANYHSEAEDQIRDLTPVSLDYSGFSIGLNPGIEKHFAGTDRLSPYIGAEVSVYNNISKYRMEYDTISPIGYLGEEIIYGKSVENKSSYLSTGVGLIAGTDFYISKNLFMGVEFSYGLYYSFPNKHTREIDGKEIDQFSSEFTGLSLNSSSSGLIRLGWKF